MPDTPPALYLDEDVSVVVAAILRARGFDVATARDAVQLGRSDSQQLDFAAAAGRVFFTHNRVDFERLHRKWLAAQRAHAGIIIARRRLPRELAARFSSRRGPGRIHLWALTRERRVPTVDSGNDDGA